MTPATSKFAFWLIPGGSFAQDIQRHIHENARRFNAPVFVPHITLASGIRSEPEPLIREFSTWATTLDPVKLKTTGVAKGESYFMCLFVRVAPDTWLSDLHSAACKRFNASGRPFDPHISLLYATPGRETLDALAGEYAGMWQAYTFHVSEIQLWETSGEVESWRRLHTCVLQA